MRYFAELERRDAPPADEGIVSSECRRRLWPRLEITARKIERCRGGVKRSMCWCQLRRFPGLRARAGPGGASARAGQRARYCTWTLKSALPSSVPSAARATAVQVPESPARNVLYEYVRKGERGTASSTLVISLPSLR